MGTSSYQQTYSSSSYNRLYGNMDNLMHRRYYYTDSNNKENVYFNLVETTRSADGVAMTTSVTNTVLAGHYWMLIPRIRGTSYTSASAYFRSSSLSTSTFSVTYFYKVCYLDCCDDDQVYGYFAYYSGASSTSLSYQRVDLDMGSDGTGTIRTFSYGNCFLVKIF